MLKIHSFKPEAECEYSNRTGECVEISMDDGSMNHAVVSIAELAKLLRFRHRQQNRHTGDASDSPKPPAPPR